MKALILAAGFGKRLQPITNEIPKSMVNVNGKPLLIHTLNILTECGITDIGIVTGHLSYYIKKHIGYKWNGAKIHYFENKNYKTTNNVYSLYKALPYCNDDLILLECDIYFQKDLIYKILNSSGDCSMVVSPFNPDTMDGTAIRISNEKPDELILGKWQGVDFNYANCQKTVNIYRFSKTFLKNLFAPLIIWYVKNISKNSYYEKILGSLIYYKECDINVVSVPENMWCEIDTLADLQRAKDYFLN